MIVPIFKGKSDVMSCGSYRGVKLLEHAMKIVERVLERLIHTRNVEAAISSAASASASTNKNEKMTVDDFLRFVGL